MYKFLILLVSIFSAYNLTNASETARIISSANSALTIQVEIQKGKLYSYLSDANEISYYQTVVLAVPFDGSIALAGLQLGTLKPFDKTNQKSISLAENKIIEFSEPRNIRGRKYVTAYIFPVTVNGIYDQIEFSVEFSGTTANGKATFNDSPFEKMMSQTVLNYEQSKEFGAETKSSFSLSTHSGPFAESSEWIKIEINKNGLYKLTGSQLNASGLTVTGQATSSIRLFNGGGKQLPVPNEEARPQFTEVALKINDGGDGTFDANDYILFYGEAVNRWIYDTTEVVFASHSYTENNVYWLNATSLTAGLRMTSVDGSLTGVVGGTAPNSFDRYTRLIHVEQNHTLRRLSNNKIGDYYTWYWTSDTALSFYVSTEHIVSGDTVDVILDGRAGFTTNPSDNINGIEFFVNGTKGTDKFCESQGGCTYKSTSFVDGSNSIDMDLMHFDFAPPYFNYLELAYTSYNQPINNQLDITLGQLSGSAEIEVVNSFTSNPLIFDVSNPTQPRELLISSYGANFSFYDTLSSTKYSRFFLMPEAQSLTPVSVSFVTTNDLHSSNEQIDLIIISPNFLQASLSDYISYRRDGGYTIQSVSVENIMDNFGFGLYDPAAIRDFLKNAYETYPDPKPSAVLFVGDASYDYLNNLSTNMPNYVPSFTHRIDNTSSDDNYVYFGDFGIVDSDTSLNVSPFDKGFDMMTSRWPIRTSSDVRTITEKIKAYESSNSFGNWRNNIALVADDEFGNTDNEYIHTTQIENLEINYLPNIYNREKIYLWEYPFVNGDKPDVNKKIVQAFNNGALLVNYVGHGNPDVWAHENVFNRASDLPNLDNISKLPLVVAASCAIGFYDDPLREGMAEELLSMSSGGAIGVVSATRLVYSADNHEFNKRIFDKLFSNNSLSICEALYTAKVERQYAGGIPRPVINDRNYLLFGGPFVKIAKPKYGIEFLSQPDSLIALGQTTVSGRIIDNDSTQIMDNGTIIINVLDSKRNKTYNNIGYEVNGPTIFRGSATITNGLFEFQFVAPARYWIWWRRSSDFGLCFLCICRCYRYY